jgi:hypothetical protein
LQRLIGENIELLTDIDAGLGMVRMGRRRCRRSFSIWC